MRYPYKLKRLLIYFLPLLPSILPAGGYLLVTSSGVPYKWNNTTAIPRDIDGGNFGTLVGSAAITFAETAIDVWASPSQSTLTLSFNTTSTSALSEDGDVNTVAEYSAIKNVIDGMSPIVFDEDGSLIAALGLPSGVIGFASIEVVDMVNNFIIESFQLYNGDFIDGDPNDAGELTETEMQAVIMHEMGHALNLDHTQINGHYFIGDTDDPGFVHYGAPPSGVEVVNLMFPFSLGGGNDASNPNIDDLAITERLYGNATAPDDSITGTVFDTDGTTEIQGVNVIARDVSDPFFGAVSNVSGSLAGAITADGTYNLSGLRGTNYTIEIVNVNPDFTEGSSVGPLDPPLSFAVEEFYNGANESENPLTDIPSEFTLVPVNTIGINPILNLDITIPVELVSFTAEVVENAVKLFWLTASETNNFGFEVEKSIDSEVFSEIGFVEGKGTTTTPQQYIFEDNDLSHGTLYYRLKQIDTDGSFDYSDMILVQVSFPEDFSLSQNYPNPFNPETKIRYELPADSGVKVSIYNLRGQKIITLFKGEQKAGRHEIIWDGRSGGRAQLASGVYFVRMEANALSKDLGQGFVRVRKMVLAK